MQRINTAKGFLWCLFVCLGITLFLVAPVSAGWTDANLDSMLEFDTAVFVLRQSSVHPGKVEHVVFPFESDTQAKDVYAFEILKIQAKLTINSSMPLPMKIKVVLGGPGYVSASRIWSLKDEGTYTTSTYFMVTNAGDAKPIGARAAVLWDPEDLDPEDPIDPKVDSILITDSINVVEP